jgi:glycosyltransferase involved in cell wall biosynthesis
MLCRATPIIVHGKPSSPQRISGMRIAFNAQLLSEPRSGTGRYIYNLLDALGRLDHASEYHIYSTHQPSERPPSPANMRWEVKPPSGLAARSAAIEKVLWEQRVFPQTARAISSDVMHIPYFAPPRRSHHVPTIVSILDVITQRLPEYRGSVGLRAYSEFVARAAQRATTIIAISQHGKQDIMETLGIPEERIYVTPLAPDPRLAPAPPDAQQELRHRLGLPGPFVLNVGGMDARKHLAGLVKAFAEVYRQLENPDLRLFIVGTPARLGSAAMFPDWRPLARKLQISDRILCAPVAEADLATLYSAADCFAFTSLYEGFGLTPLEAMACGAPVVCSNKTSLPEVVGNAALLVDPLDISALSAAMFRVLTSPDTAQELRSRGFAQARSFSWKHTAMETRSIYEMVFTARL